MSGAPWVHTPIRPITTPSTGGSGNRYGIDSVEVING